jgi:hypothetical protein
MVIVNMVFENGATGAYEMTREESGPYLRRLAQWGLVVYACIQAKR